MEKSKKHKKKSQKSAKVAALSARNSSLLQSEPTEDMKVLVFAFVRINRDIILFSDTDISFLYNIHNFCFFQAGLCISGISFYVHYGNT